MCGRAPRTGTGFIVSHTTESSLVRAVSVYRWKFVCGARSRCEDGTSADMRAPTANGISASAHAGRLYPTTIVLGRRSIRRRGWRSWLIVIDTAVRLYSRAEPTGNTSTIFIFYLRSTPSESTTLETSVFHRVSVAADTTADESMARFFVIIFFLFHCYEDAAPTWNIAILCNENEMLFLLNNLPIVFFTSYQ